MVVFPKYAFMVLPWIVLLVSLTYGLFSSYIITAKPSMEILSWLLGANMMYCLFVIGW